MKDNNVRKQRKLKSTENLKKKKIKFENLKNQEEKQRIQIE